MQQSKVVTVVAQPAKEWNGKTLLKDIVVFENGDSGTVTTFPEGTQPVVGAELEYEVETNQYGNEVKLKRTGGGGGFKAKAWTPAQVAQQDAVKITAAALESGKLELKDYQLFFEGCKSFMIEQATPSKDDLPF